MLRLSIVLMFLFIRITLCGFSMRVPCCISDPFPCSGSGGKHVLAPGEALTCGVVAKFEGKLVFFFVAELVLDVEGGVKEAQAKGSGEGFGFGFGVWEGEEVLPEHGEDVELEDDTTIAAS